MRMSLGARSRWSFGFDPPVMKIDADVRKCIVFIGHGGDADNPENFRASATGFFVNYGGCSYIVTARHVAMAFGDDPFQVRVNQKDGLSGLVRYDPTTDPIDVWRLHDDPSVDIAAVLFPYDLQGGNLDQLGMGQDLLMTDDDVREHGVGIGDTCYAIGLFRLMQGRKRNFPIVHTGSIAAVPSDEKIPMRSGNSRIEVEAYLVEISNLRGLSGCPVLVRPTFFASVPKMIWPKRGETPSVEGPVYVSVPDHNVRLLGVWAGSWDASPDDVLATDHGSQVRVPVGLGVVIPAQRLREILDKPSLVEQRATLLEKWAFEAAAVPDVNPDA
jgi:hypothetical protein